MNFEPMKKPAFILIVSLCTFLFSFASLAHTTSPLQLFSDAWNDEKYDAANTARNAVYMTETERQVIHILNLVRMNPVLFERTVLKQYPEYKRNAKLKESVYYKSLSVTLAKMNALPILLPNESCFESARCHAETSGRKAYVGHDRLTEDCKKATFFTGECISYGYSEALDIVMALLIDENVPTLGHRINFLGNFKSIGVSIQPHQSYRYNAVIDFGN